MGGATDGRGYDRKGYVRRSYKAKKRRCIGCSGASRLLLLDKLPPGWPWDGGGAGATGPRSLDLIDERFYGGELFGEVAEVGLEGVELRVEVVQGFREGLDPGSRERGHMSADQAMAEGDAKTH